MFIFLSIEPKIITCRFQKMKNCISNGRLIDRATNKCGGALFPIYDGPIIAVKRAGKCGGALLPMRWVNYCSEEELQKKIMKEKVLLYIV